MRVILLGNIFLKANNTDDDLDKNMKRKKNEKGEPSIQNSTEPISESSVSTSTNNLKPQNNIAQLEINDANMLNLKKRRHSEVFSVNSNQEQNEFSANNVSY